MAKSLLETKTAGLNAATSALNAQKGMLEVQGKMPSESQNTIDLYSKMRGSVGYEKQPRNKWRALLDGIFTGLEFAEKSKMTKEMKQRYETLLKGSEWIGSNLESINQTMAAETKKAEITEKISQSLRV
jgi:2-keto-3-deoxy-galactonokinase